MKLSKILDEIKAKPVKTPITSKLRVILFNYFKRRLNNPDLDADDRYIGDSDFSNETELKQLIDSYLEKYTWEAWEDEPIDKQLIKRVIESIKDYYTFDNTPGPDIYPGPIEEIKARPNLKVKKIDDGTDIMKDIEELGIWYWDDGLLGSTNHGVSYYEGIDIRDEDFIGPFEKVVDNIRSSTISLNDTEVIDAICDQLDVSEERAFNLYKNLIKKAANRYVIYSNFDNTNYGLIEVDKLNLEITIYVLPDNIIGDNEDGDIPYEFSDDGKYVIKNRNIVQEIKARPGGDPEKMIKRAVREYFIKQINNKGEAYIGGWVHYITNEETLDEVLNNYFKSDDWDNCFYSFNNPKLDKETLQATIKDLKFWAGDYYSDDTGPMESLLEYAQPIIDKMIKMYSNDRHHDEPQKTGYIEAFGNLKNAIKAKFENPATRNQIETLIPAELHDKNKYLDITLWKDFESLKKIVDFISKTDVDIYKKAADKFKREAGLDDNSVRYYINTFKSRLRQIDDIVSGGGENLEYIPEHLRSNNKYRFITNWGFQELEHLIDAVFPRSDGGKKQTKVNVNTADVDASKIYDKNGIEIYKGNSEQLCIKYGRNQYYGWCISRKVGSLYYNYRLNLSGNESPLTFYFVIDRNKSDEKIGSNNFKDPYHAVVIHVLKRGGFKRTTANNTGDEPGGGTSWEGLGAYFKGEQGKELWNKIKGLGKLFVHEEPSEEELSIRDWKGKKIKAEEFKVLPAKQKRFFLIANASDRNIINKDIVDLLPDNGEASINDLINSDREFSFSELKHRKSLLKRYALYRFTHHPDTPLPYKFIPYLIEPERPDPEHLQRKYFEKFVEENTTYQEIEKFFSENILKEYISNEVEKLGWLPAEENPQKYMTPEQRELYDTYMVSYSDIQVDGEWTTEKEDDDVEAPDRFFTIMKPNYKDLKSIDKDRLSKWISLIKNIGTQPIEEKYQSFFFGVPLSFLVNGQLYMFVPKIHIDPDKNPEEEYYLVDEDLNILSSGNTDSPEVFNGKDKINNNPEVNHITGDNYILSDNEFDKIILYKHNGEKEEIKKDQLGTLSESTYWFNKSLLFKAGLIS